MKTTESLQLEQWPSPLKLYFKYMPAILPAIFFLPAMKYTYLFDDGKAKSCTGTITIYGSKTSEQLIGS